MTNVLSAPEQSFIQQNAIGSVQRNQSISRGRPCTTRNEAPLPKRLPHSAGVNKQKGRQTAGAQLTSHSIYTRSNKSLKL